MDDKKERILEKIQKLMNLSKSSNPHEARRAIAQAQALMQKYKINQEDLVFLNIETKIGIYQINQEVPLWIIFLLNLVINKFGVDAYFNFDFLTEKQNICFWGINERAEVAEYVFTVLFRTIKSNRTEFLKTLNKNLKKKTKTKRADSYCTGFVLGVAQNLQDFVFSDKEKNLMDKYRASLESNQKLISKKAKSISIDQKSVNFGLEEGKKTQIFDGVKNKSQKIERLTILN